MPTPRLALNGFSATQVAEITGLSVHMINYLARHEFLQPAYGAGLSGDRARGRVRYYSYRDLVAARLVQRLRTGGVELHKLKAAIQKAAGDARWASGDASSLNWIIANGGDLFWKSDDGFLETFRADGQRAFAFIVNLPDLEAEVRRLVPKRQRKMFSMKNEPLVFAEKKRAKQRLGQT